MQARRSDRVSLSVPIYISGTAATGKPFTEKAEAIVISASGATIVVNRKLDPAQQISIHCPMTGKEANVRVVGQIKGHSPRHTYGVALLDPSVNLWDIDFLSAAESQNAFVRRLLECSRCQAREVAALNELEAEVFEVSHSLSRPCKQCNEWTLWGLVLHEAPTKYRVPGVPRHPALRTRNERKHVRVHVKMTACIRRPGLGEEVVRVENVSRSGFLFASPTIYKKGSWVEVAAPYLKGAGNVFLAARIVRTQEFRDKKLRKYGVEYFTGGEEQAEPPSPH